MCFCTGSLSAEFEVEPAQRFKERKTLITHYVICYDRYVTLGNNSLVDCSV